ncbi:MAG: toll/interleukin-1 receptor domain-containing protein, partial [Desulfobacterales bacterium]|nr:toll/interleukin-1 receptor domain-containing protein [Desulfobacterales bacterium]
MKIFISYSHKDEDWKDRVKSHLRVLQEQGLLEIWDDRRIPPGEEWLPEIEEALDACDVAIFLISTGFLTSPFILDKEVPYLLKRGDKDLIKIVPVMVKPCAWKTVDWLSKINIFPKDGTPLSDFEEPEIDNILVSLTEKLQEFSPASPPARRAAKPGMENRESLPPVQNLPRKHHMPYRSLGDRFVGRVKDLRDVDDILGEKGAAV